MPNKNRLQLSPDEKKLLEFSAGDLIPILEEKITLLHVKQTAFEHYCEKTKEVFQIQVIVTRDEDAFLDPFTIEHMKSYLHL